ncbi:DUF883 family protein [Rhodobacter ferrooxidans]|uniref:DUF883 domain-containing protein n=1 Tax=Rhodobacter ferrooxidans TaxID=371731 RepID=C8RXE8_9RHOB|nr:hypothetical protein [Rhodobacter sp. SW2]EEW26673.1 protein of unknown function DUF883 ElaB [Rhodobacter sp. SW2]
MSIAKSEFTDDLREQVAALRADLAKLTTTASEGVTEGVGAARKQVEKAGHDAKISVVDAVVANPLGAIGIAAGLGFLVGVMTRR